MEGEMAPPPGSLPRLLQMLLLLSGSCGILTVSSRMVSLLTENCLCHTYQKLGIFSLHYGKIQIYIRVINIMGPYVPIT
jgi:hypothetical protein